MKTCEWHCGDLKCTKPATHGTVVGRTEFVCKDHVDSVWHCEPYRLPLDGETLGRLLSEEYAKLPARTGDIVTDGMAVGDLLDRVAKRWTGGDL